MKNPDQNHHDHHKEWDDRKKKTECAGAGKRQKPVLQEIFCSQKNALREGDECDFAWCVIAHRKFDADGRR